MEKKLRISEHSISCFNSAQNRCMFLTVAFGVGLRCKHLEPIDASPADPRGCATTPARRTLRLCLLEHLARALVPPIHALFSELEDRDFLRSEDVAGAKCVSLGDWRLNDFCVAYRVGVEEIELFLGVPYYMLLVWAQGEVTGDARRIVLAWKRSSYFSVYHITCCLFGPKER